VKDAIDKTVSDWTPKLLLPVEGYELTDVANDNKTGLFFHALYSKTMALKGEGVKKIQKKIVLANKPINSLTLNISEFIFMIFVKNADINSGY
jgi:hypothetical protein